jgi:hypothetical protein
MSGKAGLPLIRLVTWGQGIYYLITGIWPMLHMESFLAVTGPKTDLWLVRMVALLAISIGATILIQRRGPYILHFSTALSFIAIDCYYSLNDTIRDIYLADAFAQVLVIVLLGIGMKKGAKAP